ncbi:hypothetical protein ACTFIY_002554 [Dictyostelium cf. discoideum]
MKKIILFLTVLLVLLFVGKIESHSFMKCVDWDFGSNSCAAYPRNYRFYEQQGDGFLFQRGKFTKPYPTELGQSCGPAQRRSSSITNLYSSKHPMGNFQAGQKICPQWPARNHATALRAGTVSFYLSPKMTSDAPADPSQDVFFQHSIHSSPFGNCTKYYENTNNATCTACFDLPMDISPGLYILQFFWEFNPKEYYLTCADIMISSGGAYHYHEPQRPSREEYPQRPSREELQREERQRDQEEQAKRRKRQNDEYLELQREKEREQMQHDIERKAAAEESRKHKSTIFQYIMRDGKLERDFSSASWGPYSKKEVEYYETRPILGNVLFFKCATGSNCFSSKGKRTLNINILGFKEIVSNTQVNLLTKGEKIPLSISLEPYIDSSFIDDGDSYNTIRVPLERFYRNEFYAITLSGYDDSNSDIIRVESISLSN